jgi:hypothetical protein
MQSDMGCNLHPGAFVVVGCTMCGCYAFNHPSRLAQRPQSMLHSPERLAGVLGGDACCSLRHAVNGRWTAVLQAFLQR